MELVTLKAIRLVVPGAVIFVFWWLLGRMTGLWDTEVPSDLTDANVYVIVFGAVYYATPLRDWANKPFHTDVSGALRSGLVRISGLPDSDIFTWKALRGIFYWLVDQDATLSKKATLIYWNGAVWTSCADVRVLSTIFAILSLILAWLRVGERGVVAAVVFGALAVFTVPISYRITKRQKELGEEQLEVIEHNYQETLRTKMERVLERFHT